MPKSPITPLSSSQDHLAPSPYTPSIPMTRRGSPRKLQFVSDRRLTSSAIEHVMRDPSFPLSMDLHNGPLVASIETPSELINEPAWMLPSRYNAIIQQGQYNHSLPSETLMPTGVEHLHAGNPFEVDERTGTLNPFNLVTRSLSMPQSYYQEGVFLGNLQSSLPPLPNGTTSSPEMVRSVTVNPQAPVLENQPLIPEVLHTFTCEMVTVSGLVCNADIPVQMLSSHINSAHPPLNLTGNPREQKEVTCAWSGCICPPQGRRRSRCGGRLDGHAAHVADLIDHIEKVHLRMLYSCDLCGHASWTSKSALERHRTGRPAGKDKELRPCPGKKTCVCRVCFRSFPSVVSLEGHLHDDDCRCPGPVGP